MNLNLRQMFLQLASDVDLDPFSVRYCLKRLDSEGAAFLTKCLPRLSQAVLASLEKGYFDRPTDFAFKGRSLRAFRSLLSGIFDEHGNVLDQVDPLAILRLRQLCEYFYKLALPYSESDLLLSERKFIEEDLSLSGAIDQEYVEVLRKDFETYFPEASSATESEILKAGRPAPGPGTFSGTKGFDTQGPFAWWNLKNCDRRPTKKFLGCVGLFKPYPGKPGRRKLLAESVRENGPAAFHPACSTLHTTWAEDTSNCSELLFVPKDSRGPRTIVREPYRALMAQMAAHRWLKGMLERATRRRVNFESQEINRLLAESSSKTKEWCTIDLKSASDRVSYRCISTIVRNSPGLRCLLRKSRTKSVRLPSGHVWTLRKLAGMGSGFTFPMMSLLISLAITRALVPYYRVERIDGDRAILRSKRAAYKAAQACVYVYGDDIIVPTRYYHVAVEALAKVGLHINPQKCFVTSLFRESCGGDFYNGNDVAPVRLKLASANPVCTGLTIALDGPADSHLRFIVVERHCRELVKAGLLGLANYLYRVLEKDLGCKLPAGTGDTPYFCRWQHLLPSYNVKGTGEYEKVFTYLPAPRTRKVRRDPYIYLGQKLAPDVRQQDAWVDVLFDKSDVGRFEEVELPRDAIIRPRKVSAFALMA